MSAPVSASEDAPLISQALLDLLVCPLDKAPLELIASTLVCTVCRRVYPIEDGIPNMLVDETE